MSDLGIMDAAPRRVPRIRDYYEAPDRRDTTLDRWAADLNGAFVAQGARWRAWRLRPILREMERHAVAMAALDDAGLQAEAQAARIWLRRALRDQTLSVAAAGRAFALVREAADRVLGLRHYDVQALGAWAMMRGQIAEMRTGEGKTLCATLAVATTALSGRQVHVMTVNDYLAERDSAEMAPLYRFLGLSVATVLEGQDAETRQSAYGQDIVYGTNKEIAFDYLRDRAILRLKPGNLNRKLDRILPADRRAAGLRLQGLPVAIIDEADSVLIDEARTPLIISGANPQQGGLPDTTFRRAMAAARTLTEDVHFRRPRGIRRIEILPDGFEALDRMADADLDRPDTDPAFGIPVIREHLVYQALSALYLFELGDSYILRDGKVQIVDENTGRTMPDRTWSDGLHQMVELKEGLEPTAENETLSRMTYQRFFRRYACLGGMTGTAQDAAWELWSVYRLAVAKVPTNKRDIRRFARDRVFLTTEAKWQAIAERTRALHAAGAPVLIGTRSINASDAASARLSELGLPHQLLTAAQDADEAAIVAEAGQAGRITVATNMAGRGTDIKLSPDALAAGGLHVILSERHDSRRVDRQLEGRCGRQGEPGRVEAYLSLEDDLMQGPAARRVAGLAKLLARAFGPGAAGWCIRWRQKQMEAAHGRMRRDLIDQDRGMGEFLAFGGELE
ncbi:preprotein translocase subunit SecA [Oceanomicrobium pacificus]|uniref:Protein translocase subunit SecA n=1 Tax=Oceanomicrobium pacificus TaxID=2692916 RepID=A0A6B0TZL5_9RHOB|nr:DEAD/DEAH box helicase [Oceanomicrobium pacificus]MXU66702.1 DEAD/DEAH box helicase [Oceanomicrobium pacificus]